MSVTLSDLKKDFASQSKPLSYTEKGNVKGYNKPIEVTKHACTIFQR